MAELKQLSKKIGSKIILDRLDLRIDKGRTLGIFGTNGAGKTSLARILAQLDAPSDGKLTVEDLGRAVLIQQDFVVWPHLSVTENVAIACQGSHKRDKKWVLQWLDRFHLLDKAGLAGGQLSYGQQQRLSLARAFASKASFFIFDEVFSGLDAMSHLPLLLEVQACLEEQNVTSVWISHNWSEISMLCDQVAILSDGKILQIAAPSVVYDRPASLEVAKMTGQVNILTVEDWNLLTTAMVSAPRLDLFSENTILLRPEDIQLNPSPKLGSFTLENKLFRAPGYLQEIELNHKLLLQLFTIDPRPNTEEGSIELRKTPCVLPFSSLFSA